MRKIIFTFFLMFIFTAKVFAGDYYIVGVDCFNKGLYDKSTVSLEHAVRISPKNVDARYFLAQSYLMQKRTGDAIEQYNRIIILAPSSQAARLSQKGLSLIAQSYKESSVGGVSDLSLEQYKDNYLDYVLAADGTLKKWKTFPISVYIEPKRQKAVVQRAFEEWQSKTGDLVKFKYVNSPQVAQITMDFMDKLESSSTKESYVAGYSKPYYQGDYIVRSEIHILTIDPLTRKSIDDDFIFFSALHELGHSLGFAGHSPNSNDVMAGQSDVAKTSLTQRDINTMNVFYKMDKKSLLAKGSSQTDVKLQQAIAYAKATPDKAVGWANLGDLYRGKKMYAEAIKNYKKAIAIEPNKAELYNLIGATYQSMNDSANAFSNLKKACDMDKSNVFYLYQFVQVCVSTGQKQIGRDYVTSYVKANPQAAFDPKIQSLMKGL